MTTFGGQWTQEKLNILKRYLDEYTTVLKKQRFRLIYVDAFAGEGYWHPKPLYPPEIYGDFDDVRDGSVRIALQTENRPFDHFVFIEKEPARCASLELLKQEFQDRSIQIDNDDANNVLVSFCDNLKHYERAVVFVDPYATQMSWATVEAIAATKKIDCWILFPVGAIARNMPTRQEPTAELAANHDRVFGDRKYWRGLYQEPAQLSMLEKRIERPGGSGPIADKYRMRLQEVFEDVAPTQRIFTNSRNSPMFELFFAASNPSGAPIAIPIADHILQRW